MVKATVGHTGEEFVFPVVLKDLTGWAPGENDFCVWVSCPCCLWELERDAAAATPCVQADAPQPHSWPVISKVVLLETVFQVFLWGSRLQVLSVLTKAHV